METREEHKAKRQKVGTQKVVAKKKKQTESWDDVVT